MLGSDKMGVFLCYEALQCIPSILSNVVRCPKKHAGGQIGCSKFLFGVNEHSIGGVYSCFVRGDPAIDSGSTTTRDFH